MAEGDSSGLPKLVLTRVFDAPRALVFKAWTDPRHVARWWGPKGFTNPVCELDARPGGAIKILMRGPDGSEYPMTGQFRDVVPPERLVFVSQAIEDETGIPRLQVETTVTFAERGGKTTITVHADVTAAGPGTETALAGMEIGWTQTLDRLGDLVARL